MFFKPEGCKKPLLVTLHTWSAGYDQPNYPYAEWCVKYGWAFIHPDFRGYNNKPEACGSDLTVQDIVDAVKYAQTQADIDPERIYLAGCSGGGYLSLVMAGRHPEIWAGVSAWVPILDLAEWHRDSSIRKNGYATHMELSCGGTPGSSPAVDAEYRKRSAITYLANAKGIPVEIGAGIHDGHRGSVPIRHTLNAFNILANPAERIDHADIEYMTEKEAVPSHLQDPDLNDPLYGNFTPLFRKVSDNARVTIFEGGHTAVVNAALAWLNEQRQGTPVRWEVKSSLGENVCGVEVAH